MLLSHITLRTKSSVFLVSIGLIFASTTIAFSAPVSTNSGYNFCVNNKTKIVSYTQAKQCPIGSTLINVGKQGVVGVKGDTGATGLPGAASATGVSGAAGPAGPAGATGVSGAAGPAGPGGVAGAAGPAGATGAAGAVGATGAAGAVGAVGATGAAGAVGATGSTGAVGATGAAGIGPLYIATIVTPDEALQAAVDFNSPTASLTLPAGSYLLTLNVFVRATGRGYNYVECQIDDQTLHTDESKMIFVSGAFDYSRAAYITKIKTLTITDARVVPAQCYTGDEDYTEDWILLKDLTFTAIRVSSITGP